MPEQRVAIVTGASQGMGAALVAALRGEGYAVVATARSIEMADEDDLLTIAGDISQRDTALRVAEGATGRFGRIDCLVNMAGVHTAKRFAEYTRATSTRWSA
jgi:NAD(P)-dependent dehydrogenase (short-subunit alcohol dehydrogenase family)